MSTQTSPRAIQSQSVRELRKLATKISRGRARVYALSTEIETREEVSPTGQFVGYFVRCVPTGKRTLTVTWEEK